MNIFTVRHGESDKDKTKNDWQYPLTPKGCSQANIAGEFLKDFFQKHNLSYNNSIILYSPYFRTQQTAEIISQKLPLITQKLYGVIEYKKNSLILENKNIQDYTNSLLESNPLLKNLFEANLEIAQNETPNEIILRAKQAILHISKLNYENVILVTHNGFIRAFDIAFLNNQTAQYFDCKKIRNCSIRHYEITEDLTHIYHGEILEKAKQEEILEK